MESLVCYRHRQLYMASMIYSLHTQTLSQLYHIMSYVPDSSKLQAPIMQQEAAGGSKLQAQISSFKYWRGNGKRETEFSSTFRLTAYGRSTTYVHPAHHPGTALPYPTRKACNDLTSNRILNNKRSKLKCKSVEHMDVILYWVHAIADGAAG